MRVEEKDKGNKNRRLEEKNQKTKKKKLKLKNSVYISTLENIINDVSAVWRGMLRIGH